MGLRRTDSLAVTVAANAVGATKLSPDIRRLAMPEPTRDAPALAIVLPVMEATGSYDEDTVDGNYDDLFDL